MVTAVTTRPVSWITPQEQLKRLIKPVIKKIKAVLVKDLYLLPSVLNTIVIDYAIDPNLTNWYKALNRLKALPGLVPELPNNLMAILNAQCLIFGSQVTDTHFLVLIPSTLGTLNQLEKRVQKQCGSCKFQHFLEDAREAYGDSPFEPTHWELITKQPIPDDENYTFFEQDARITSSFKPYCLLSLKSMVTALFLYKIATGIRLYPSSEKPGGWVFTLVKESANDLRLYLGGFNEEGLVITFCYAHNRRVRAGVRRLLF